MTETEEIERVYSEFAISAFIEKRAPDFPLRVSTDMPDTPWWPQGS